MSSGRPSVPENLVISYRAMAVGATIIALASLGTVVVIASINDVDTLSTVALALAIIAFVAQLIVFVVQSASASSQLTQSQELFGNIRALLVEVSERAEGTRTTVTSINERLLEAALGKAISEKGDRPSGLNVRDVAREVAAALTLAEEQATGTDDSEGFLPRRPSPEDQRIIQSFLTFPDPAEAAASLEVLQSLDGFTLRRLITFAEDEVRSRSPGSSLDPGLSGDIDPDDPLFVNGLIIEAPESRSLAGRPIRVLSQRGREAARLLTAVDTPPAEVASGVELLRRRAADPNLIE